MVLLVLRFISLQFVPREIFNFPLDKFRKVWYNSITERKGDTMNTQIQAMRKLGFTDEEIAEVMEADKKIDQGEKLFELTAEQEKASKQARQADRKPKVYDLDNTGGKRNKKVNNAKIELLQNLIDAIPADVEIQNPEREFTFIYKDVKYKVVLSIPRT